MATASVTASLPCRSTFVFLVIFLGCFQHVLCYAPSIEVTCKSTVDLGNNNFDAGLIVSMLPPRIPIYAQEEERCDVYLSIPTGHEMMLYFDWLDLYSGELSKCDTTNIELFDGSANNYVKGLNRKICGREEQMPTNVYFVENNFLVIRVNALGVIQGTGFRIHFTISRRAFPCSNDEFACETFGSRRCIAEHLVCDDWNDCGDWVDEEQNCNNITAGGIAAIVVASLLLIALIVGLIIFCKIRRQHELREMSEKEAAIMRDQSIASGGGMVSPFSVSSETMEKAPYMPRFATGRNSGRRSQASVRNIGTDDRPPPYSEKPSFEDSRSEGDLYDDQDAPRTRSKSRNRESTPDDVFLAEEDVPRTRRGRSKSQDRAPSRVEEEPVREERYPAREGGRHPSRRDDRDSPPEDRYPREKNGRLPSRRDDRDSPRSDHYSRDRDDGYPPRRDDNESRHSREDDLERERDRYPSRRDDRDRDRDRDGRYPSRRDDRDRDEDRYPSRRDDRDRDEDRYPSRRDDRDRDEDRYPSRRDDRDRDRERDRDSRRDRPRSRREPSPDENGGVPDQLHPLRDLKRRSMHSDSDQDTSREDRRSREDVRPQSRDDRHNRSRDRDREREDRPRDDRYPGDDRQPPRVRDDRPPPVRDDRSPSTRDDRPVRDERSPSTRDDRPASTRADRPRDTPTSRSKDPTPDDSYESAQEVPPASNRGRRTRPDARDTPPAPPPEEKQPELAAEELPSRRRRRRSRSRDGQDRPRSSRHGEEPEEGGGRRSKAPMAQMDDEPRRPGGRQSMGGYKEETV